MSGKLSMSGQGLSVPKKRDKSPWLESSSILWGPCREGKPSMLCKVTNQEPTQPCCFEELRTVIARVGMNHQSGRSRCMRGQILDYSRPEHSEDFSMKVVSDR